MSDDASADLRRAVELSHALLGAADRGESGVVASIDAERLQLLKSSGRSGQVFDADQRMLLQEIALLNDKSIGCLEHHRRIKQRQMETAAVGRRAVRAYSNTR